MKGLAKLKSRLLLVLKDVRKITSTTSESNHVSIVRFIFIFLFASLLLSGCVKYDVGVNFENSNSGELVQHIQLGERLTSFSSETVYEWLNSIEHRAQKMEGKVKRISQEEVIVRIPFSNGAELQTKFNEFFNPNGPQGNQPSEDTTDPETTTSEIPQLESKLNLEQKNFFLIEKNHLVYDLDLRSLSFISSQGNISSDTESILNLEFSLKAPWAINNIPTTEEALSPEKLNNQLVWHLNPGEINHIEAVFWLPNLLGIGSLLIIFFIVGGIYLRYYYMTPPQIKLAAEKPATSGLG
ncbi:hypothetical protein RintRC_3381 [Richelia intracellularis]|nr:hypothetical protein RintRC_3381 [Richelia intracellularis]